MIDYDISTDEKEVFRPDVTWQLDESAYPAQRAHPPHLDWYSAFR